MKKFFLAAVALFSTLGFYSCSDDFEVGAPYKNVTFVYGLLNVNDTAHYIRIQKAFFDENRNALTLAQIADSSFYSDLQVVIREIGGGNVKNIPLTRVNLIDEGIIKDSGSFFTSPHYAYKFKDGLNTSYSYRLVISNPSLTLNDSSEISIVDTANFNVPPAEQNNYFLNFSDTKPVNPVKSYFLCLTPKNAAMIEGKIRFYWMDKNTVTKQETDRNAEYIFSTGVTTIGSTSIFCTNLSVYYFLQNAIGKAPQNVERYMDSCDLTISVGGADLLKYFNVANSADGGLTADLISPLYTNIAGENVYGIFSSRTSIVYRNVPLSLPTIDSFRVNPITAGLNIKGVSPK
ncbi:MAG TPA: hypothetical protein VL098_06170 [Flavipsychrobacter sp.]|nr:hypothetical protein [Flavipsychrobacter sp.]